MKSNKQLKYSNYVVFNHFHGIVVNNSGLATDVLRSDQRGIQVKKTVLYLDLLYHIKTGSSGFLLDMLKIQYEVDVYYYVPELQIIKNMHQILDKEYDFLVCWQVMPEDFVLLQLHYKKGIFFPMYDNIVGMPDEKWDIFREFMIISFSRNLYEYLKRRGFYTRYIQYFPSTKPVSSWGERDSLFFWQRVTAIDLNYVFRFCKDLSLKEIHIHNALDPGNYCDNTEPDSFSDCNVKYSTWFKDKADLQNLILQSAYYMAPRLYEGIGMSFLEAMAMGRCVIAPDHPTMNEYIRDGETGLLYNYQNPVLSLHGDIRKIQKNTYEYVSEGYQKWENERFHILDWMEEHTQRKGVSIKKAGGNHKQIKFKRYFDLLNEWLRIKNQWKCFETYFLDFDFLKIAVYGGGEIGIRLIEELDKTPIEISCVIDRNADRMSLPVPVIHPEDIIPDVDAIIVTPFCSFEEIYRYLKEKTKCPIISISEVVGFYCDL